jgi:hypothetical protein
VCARVPVIAKMNVEEWTDLHCTGMIHREPCCRHDAVQYTNLDALACGMVVVHVYLGALRVHTD